MISFIMPIIGAHVKSQNKMKATARNSFGIIFIILFCGSNTKEWNPNQINSEYNDDIFLKSKKTLIYNSTFGETTSTIRKRDSLYVMTTEGEDFYYRQSYLLKNDGIFIYETYQKMSPMIFVNIEDKYTYNSPVMRLPLPIESNNSWEWRGVEYCDDEKSNLVVKGNILKTEKLKTKAGTFETTVVETIISSENGTENILKEWINKDYGIIKSEVKINGGGIMGMIRDILGYGNIYFELEEIK